MNSAPISHSRGLSLSAALLVVAVTSAIGLAAPASAATTSAYNSIPPTYTAADASLGFGVTSTAELGQNIDLAGTDRVLEDVSIGFTSWACEVGVWNNGCLSTPGSSFDLPITLNVYASLPDSDVDGTLPGDLLATVTAVVAVPFRPAADPIACEGDAGWFFDAEADACVPGVAFIETFDLASLGAVLPDQVIVSVAFDSAVEPGHSDALNVSLQTDGPSVGSEPNPDNLFWDTTTASYYTDGGAGGVGIFRSDSGWGSTGLMLIQVDVTSPAPAAAPVLAATGSDAASIAGIAGLLLLLGAAVVAVGVHRRNAAG